MLQRTLGDERVMTTMADPVDHGTTVEEMSSLRLNSFMRSSLFWMLTVLILILSLCESVSWPLIGQIMATSPFIIIGVPRLHLIASMSFWQNATPFCVVAPL